MEGWISIHRRLLESELWVGETFTRGQAWIDLIGLANHKSGYIRIRGNRIEVKRGQCGWSIQKLSKRWGWSQGKIKRFFKELENDEQIEEQNSFVSSLITIVNYEQYQKTESRRRADGEQTETNNNDNKEKEKEKYKKEIDEIYLAYPSKCVIRGSSTGKALKDKDKIKGLLKERTKDELLGIIKRYVDECRRDNVYMKNFKTFLNNLPDYEGGKSDDTYNISPRQEMKM